MIELRHSTGCDLTTNSSRLQLADTTLVSHEVDGACMSAKPLRPSKLLALLPPCNEHRGTGLCRRPSLNRQRAALSRRGKLSTRRIRPRGKGGWLGLNWCDL